MEFARTKTEQRHHETRGIPAGRLRGASKRRTSGDQPAGLHETSGVAAGQASNQQFCEGSAREDGPVISRDTQGVRANRTFGVRAVRANAEEFEDGQ